MPWGSIRFEGSEVATRRASVGAAVGFGNAKFKSTTAAYGVTRSQRNSMSMVVKYFHDIYLSQLWALLASNSECFFTATGRGSF
uniref:Uncharacterized protein n=1 Tax=Arundo donax TaxID=35708 RepID=A0A0A9AKU0_ARUDO